MRALKYFISGLLGIIFITGCFILIVRTKIESTIFNEANHYQHHQEYNFYEGIKKQIDLQLQRAITENNLEFKLDNDFITQQEIEASVKLLTQEYIEVFKGNKNNITRLDFDPYMVKMKELLIENGYEPDQIMRKSLFFVQVYGILKQYTQIINSEVLAESEDAMLTRAILAFTYSDFTYKVSLSAVVGSVSLLFLLWRQRLKKTLVYLFSLLLILGIFMSTGALYLYKASLIANSVQLGSTTSNIFSRVYNSLFYEVFRFSGIIVINTIIVIGGLLVLKEIKNIMLEHHKIKKQF